MGVYAFFVSSGVGRSGPTPNRRRLACARAGRKNLGADKAAVANPTVRNFRRLLRGEFMPTSIVEGSASRGNEHDQPCAADDRRIRKPRLFPWHAESVSTRRSSQGDCRSGSLKWEAWNDACALTRTGPVRKFMASEPPPDQGPFCAVAQLITEHCARRYARR